MGVRSMRLSGVNISRSRAFLSQRIFSSSSSTPERCVRLTDGTTGASRDLTVFFDGSCPLCSKEISHLSKLDESSSGQRAIEFVDITSLTDDEALRAKIRGSL